MRLFDLSGDGDHACKVTRSQTRKPIKRKIDNNSQRPVLHEGRNFNTTRRTGSVRNLYALCVAKKFEFFALMS